MKYIANPVEADAFVIELVVPCRMIDDKPTELQLHMTTGEVRTADAGMIARYIPKPGDYYVVQSDGYVYLNPKEVFEYKYRKATKGNKEIDLEGVQAKEFINVLPEDSKVVLKELNSVLRNAGWKAKLILEKVIN